MGIVILNNTDALYFLSADNSLFIGPGATLYSTTIFAIPVVESLASGRTVQIEGTLLSQTANALILNDDGFGAGDHTVVVGDGGAVYGNRNYATVVVDGTGNLVQNFGLISGGGGVWGFGWGAGRLENDGTIAGQRFTAVKLLDGVGANTIVNGGLITGAGGVALQNATATIVNEAGGEIRSNTASVAAVDGAAASAGFVLRNSGAVTGLDDAILGSGFADTVRNKGAIVGDVLLGNGNDQFRGRSGTLDGELRGGGGNDTLVTGQGDDSLFGDAGVDRLDGGAGDDLLTGGTGNDVFVFTRAGVGGADTLADFTNGQDTLDLAAFRFAGFAAVAALATDGTGGMLLDLTGRGAGTVLLAGFTKAQFDATDVLL